MDGHQHTCGMGAGPDDGRAPPKDTTICIDVIGIGMIGVRGGKNHCEGVRPRGSRGTQSLPRTQVQTVRENLVIF